MSWNYRMCQYKKKGYTLYSIREVFYAADGKTIEGHTDASVHDWETLEDLKGTLNLMRTAFKKPLLILPAKSNQPITEKPSKKTARKRKAAK